MKCWGTAYSHGRDIAIAETKAVNNAPRLSLNAKAQPTCCAVPEQMKQELLLSAAGQQQASRQKSRDFCARWHQPARRMLGIEPLPPDQAMRQRHPAEGWQHTARFDRDAGKASLLGRPPEHDDVENQPGGSACERAQKDVCGDVPAQRNPRPRYAKGY